MNRVRYRVEGRQDYTTFSKTTDKMEIIMSTLGLSFFPILIMRYIPARS